MSLRGPRCGKHPSHMLVGVCAFCLRERLAGLADVECASDSHTPNSKKKKNPSPGRSLVVPASHHPISKSSGRRGFDQPIIINSATPAPIALKGVQPEPISPITPARTHAFRFNKPAIVDTACHVDTNTNQALNQQIISKTCPRPSINLAREPIRTCSPKPNEIRGSITIDDAEVPITVGGMGCDKIMCSTGISAGRHSFSSAKRPSLASMEGSKLLPVDIKMPILENNQHTPMEFKSCKFVQKDTSIECASPLAGINELVPFENKAHFAASFDSETSGFNDGRQSLPCNEPKGESNLSAKDVEIVLSDASPNPMYKKKTLSSLFSLDDAEFPAAKTKTEESKNISSVKGDVLFNGSSSAPAQNVLQGKMSQRRCRHGSFSERVEPSKYLFPVPETGSSKPLSWFSSLFRRRKKKSLAKSVEALASFSEHNNGWEDARQSWEAPRPSSWEQFRFSSFEGPRSSWEPARPSWEGVMRTSDGESVFSGFDFLTESLAEMREDAGIDRKNPQELATGVCANGFSDARRFTEGKRLGSKSKSLAPKMPHLDDKDRAHTFLSAKAMLMQRDVSTQTTPPRSSDATELYIHQRLQHDRHRRRQYAKASHAVWSKVWTKTFSNSKWAFKQKHHKERRPTDMEESTTALDEAHDQGNLTSGRSSFCEGINAESNRHAKLAQFDNIKDHEGWDTFYSPSQQNRDGNNVGSRLASKGDACMQKEEHIDKVRGSNFMLENGLLKFYLTPVRGHGIRGKSKQGIHGV